MKSQKRDRISRLVVAEESIELANSCHPEPRADNRVQEYFFPGSPLVVSQNMKLTWQNGGPFHREKREKKEC